MTDDYIDVAQPGEQVRLPLVDILTGRGFVTGKSGSGKSTSVNVIVEELLDRNQPLLIVDTDGEYWGLKEQYGILHLGNGEQCDVRVTATDAETIVELALIERVPIILDTSGFLHKEDAQEVTYRVVRELFHREKTLKEPFLLVVEEVHEYIPETGGLSEFGKMLIQVAKRGRKHGLGFLGVSQRPASVDKDFITQCDWIVWHRLTWKNDTEVVRTILGSDAAGTVEELDPGQALLMTDWDEQVRQVQFRMKRTFDAGATPGFDDFQPPELVPVNPAILNRFDERRQNVDYGDVDDTSRPTADEDNAADDGSDDESEPEGRVIAETTPIDDVDDPEPADAEATAGESAVDDSPETEATAAVDAERGVATGEHELAPDDSAGATADRPPLGDEPIAEAEIVARQPGADAPVAVSRGERAPGRARPGGPPPPPTTTGEGVVVEFAQLVLFLVGWVRKSVENGLIRVVGGVGRLVSAGAGWIQTVRLKTHLADEDVVVAMWLALVIGFILLLSVVLVTVL